MAQKRKLQVFVSSTYTDLVAERQTAVEAILTAGHIPAGMELFAGQNEEQMNIIKEWIDESDIYLLLLGGRYGSIDETTNKSYTHLEYEYAKQSGKVVFAVVAHDDYISNKVLKNNGKPDGVIELDYRNQYTEFKKSITGKYVKYWTSDDSLKLAITNTLHVLERDEKLIGWVPGSEATKSADFAEMSAQLTKIVKENYDLRAQLSNKANAVGNTFNGLEFDDAYSYLSYQEIEVSGYHPHYQEVLEYLPRVMQSSIRKPSALHFFWVWNKISAKEECNTYYLTKYTDAINPLEELRLIDEVPSQNSYGTKISTGSYAINDSGARFMLRLKLEFSNSYAESLVDKIRKMERDGYFDPINTF